MGALGYERFGAQGGDWGSFVSVTWPTSPPTGWSGCTSTTSPWRKPADAAPLSEQEQREREALDEAAHRGRLPGAAGHEAPDARLRAEGLPAGLAAWIIEKFETWSEGRPPSVYSLDHLLTNVMVYWVTGTAASSCRIYWEMRQAGGKAVPQAPVTVPTGIARYPGEVTKFPRAWIERRYNVTYWSEPARGGHFAAMEAPTEFVDDVRVVLP